ncbi:MAG TPA: DUF2844 domain-containing protein [Bryobacteraceae bacterium]|nr:DUF2844 domain-containing protein [Bryobacteraceae bacterium]
MRILVAVSLLVCSSTIPAWAALGQSHESIKFDMQVMKGKLATRELPGYSVKEITRPDGAILREFVSPQGQVFGVAWQGMTMPNLPQILGPSADAFQKATQARPHRGPLSVHVGQLVVETGGHMRAFRVRAIRLDLLPSGISEDVVQ